LSRDTRKSENLRQNLERRTRNGTELTNNFSKLKNLSKNGKSLSPRKLRKISRRPKPLLRRHLRRSELSKRRARNI
jgi:hypothetical protein